MKQIDATKQKLYRYFIPPIYRTYLTHYKPLREQGFSRKEAWNESKSQFYRWFAEVALTFSLHQLTAATIGVRAWDPKMEHGAGRISKDSSRLALWLSTTIASAVPPQYANALVASEYALCIARISLEQFALERTGITPDIAGPILSPALAGSIEMVLKTFELGNLLHMSETARIQTAIAGIWGNLVRMVEAVGIILLRKALENFPVANVLIGDPSFKKDTWQQ